MLITTSKKMNFQQHDLPPPSQSGDTLYTSVSPNTHRTKEVDDMCITNSHCQGTLFGKDATSKTYHLSLITNVRLSIPASQQSSQGLAQCKKCCGTALAGPLPGLSPQSAASHIRINTCLTTGTAGVRWQMAIARDSGRSTAAVLQQPPPQGQVLTVHTNWQHLTAARECSCDLYRQCNSVHAIANWRVKLPRA